MKRTTRWVLLIMVMGEAIITGLRAGCPGEDGIGCDHRLLVTVRALIEGIMCAAGGLWLSRWRIRAGQPDMALFFNLSLCSGTLLLIGSLLFLNRALNPALMWMGLVMNSTGLMTGLLLLIIDPVRLEALITSRPCGGGQGRVLN